MADSSSENQRVYELDSTSISSAPSQPTLATGSSSHSANQARKSSYAPGRQNETYQAYHNAPQEGPYRMSSATLRSPANSASKRGRLIAFEGLDRSGKSTQCALLVERLRDRGETVEHIRFPNRTTPIGQMINSYLSGESEIEDHVIHLLFSANRWEMAPKITKLINEGVTVVVDRYYYSGCVYSAAKNIPGLGLEWARHPDVGLPRPDLCIFLDVSPETAAQRGGFGQEKYEQTDMQIRVRELFEVLLAKPDESNDVVVVNADREVPDVERTIQKWVGLVEQRVEKEGLALGEVRSW